MNVPIDWHRNTAEQWQRYTASGHMPHAMLLAGPAGIGKRNFADALAAGVLCEQAVPDPAGLLPATGCGECRGCRQRLAGSHPDMQLLQRPDGKQQIAIDQVRAAIQRLQLSTHAGGYKVLIIDEAERLNYAAANSLLKTLEEPTDKTLILLVCSAPQALPATIRSRCQQLSFAAPAVIEATEWLQAAEPAANAVDIAITLEIANGAPLAAQLLLQEGYAERFRVWREGWLKIIEGKADPVALAGQWHRDEATAVVTWLQHWVIALLQYQAAGRQSALFVDIEDVLSARRERIDAVALLHYYERYLLAAPRWLQGSANAQMQLEALLLAWAGKKVPVMTNAIAL